MTNAEIFWVGILWLIFIYCHIYIILKRMPDTDKGKFCGVISVIGDVYLFFHYILPTFNNWLNSL